MIANPARAGNAYGLRQLVGNAEVLPILPGLPMHADLAAFRHCPVCTAAPLYFEGDKAICCRACGFRYFHNVAVAVAAVIRVGDEILLAERAHAPRAGTFDLPGGFVDPDETLEEAVCREVREELGLALDANRLRYLFSSTNRYPFEGTTYRTSDVYFEVRLPARPPLVFADDVAGAIWRTPFAARQETLSFPTVAAAMERLDEAGSAG